MRHPIDAFLSLCRRNYVSNQVGKLNVDTSQWTPAMFRAIGDDGLAEAKAGLGRRVPGGKDILVSFVSL